jgi:hypothetical protein
MFRTPLAWSLQKNTMHACICQHTQPPQGVCSYSRLLHHHHHIPSLQAPSNPHPAPQHHLLLHLASKLVCTCCWQLCLHTDSCWCSIRASTHSHPPALAVLKDQSHGTQAVVHALCRLTAELPFQTEPVEPVLHGPAHIPGKSAGPFLELPLESNCLWSLGY